jgi:hypothetical protein
LETITKPFIKPEIFDFTESELTNYLRNEAGSSNPNYFKANVPGLMKLQQVPEEYSKLLLYLKSRKIKNYLALGVGNGGSFAMECFFMQESLENAIEIDNLEYGQLINQSEEEIKSFIEIVRPSLKKDCNIQFYKSSTDDYFSQLKPNVRFDAIFIDADHSYEGALKDYKNALYHIAHGGLIIFHDINSVACPGIVKLWKEVKEKIHSCKEFIFSEICGIGVVQMI